MAVMVFLSLFRPKNVSENVEICLTVSGNIVKWIAWML